MIIDPVNNEVLCDNSGRCEALTPLEVNDVIPLVIDVHCNGNTRTQHPEQVE